jgi:Domain of unknown function (DUF4136)
MTRKAVAMALMLVLAIPVQAGAKVTSDTTPGVNFSQYKSFTIVNPTPPAGMNPVAYERIRTGVEQGMTGKGYTSGSPADLSVIITIGAQDKTDISTWGAFGRQVNVSQYTVGSLSVDVFETASKRPLWHGQATATITPGRVSPEKIDKAVGQIMAKMPAH